MRPYLGTLVFTIVLAAVFLSGCNDAPKVTASTIGSPERGRAIIVEYGCGKCHTIPGIHDANGVVGPPLASVTRRTYIAGTFPNNPENLTHWIMASQTMKPKTAMPSLGLSEPRSRDVVAYLETLQ